MSQNNVPPGLDYGAFFMDTLTDHTQKSLLELCISV